MSALGDGVSALVVPVPAAEPVVGRHRRRLDPTAADGMPAHVTLLAPFLPPSRVDRAVAARLTALFAATRAFRFDLGAVAWFGVRVAYLAPQPSAPFVELTEALCAAFPSLAPYGGAFGSVVPHLTIGEGTPLQLPRRLCAAVQVRTSLPVEAQASAVWLMVSGPPRHSWRRMAEFTLGAG